MTYSDDEEKYYKKDPVLLPNGEVDPDAEFMIDLDKDAPIEINSKPYDGLKYNAGVTPTTDGLSATEGTGSKSLGERILGIIMVIWFAGSIVAATLLGETKDSSIILLVIGQIFFFAGVMAIVSSIKAHEFPPVPLFLFPLIGGTLMVYGYVLTFGKSSARIKFDNLAPYLLLGLFVLVGIGLLVAGIYLLMGALKDKKQMIKSGSKSGTSDGNPMGAGIGLFVMGLVFTIFPGACLILLILGIFQVS